LGSTLDKSAIVEDPQVRVKRIILTDPVAIAARLPSRLIDAGAGGVDSMALNAYGVEVCFSDAPDAVIIPMANIQVLIPERESPEEIVAALETAPPRPRKTPTDPDGRRRR
jgi:hypothetical protein